MKIGKLYVVIGLPGAGKSTFIKETLRHTVFGVCAQDFHANALDHSPQVLKSRYFRAVYESLIAGLDCAIADIEFTQSDRLEKVQQVFKLLLPGLDLECIYFENDIKKCQTNVRYRNSVDLNNELQKISKLSVGYTIPSNVTARPVTLAEPL